MQSPLSRFNQVLYRGHDGLIHTQVLEAGKRAGSVPEPVIPGRNGYPRNPIVNLMYTSGSSGRPKGAEYTESMYCSFLQVAFHHQNSLYTLIITSSPAVPAHQFLLILGILCGRSCIRWSACHLLPLYNCMHSLEKYLTCVSAWLQNPFPPNAPSMATIQLGFLPLNHLMGRMTLLKCLLTGGQVCACCEPILELMTITLRMMLYRRSS